ncbi:hypothetical protein QUS89_22615, partial [Xanthomonas citri pv. citri]
IKKAYAFSQPYSSGNAPADSVNSHMPLQTYFAYLEISGDALPVKIAWLDGVSYYVSTDPVPKGKVTPGVSLSNKKISISPATGNRFIHLHFSPSDPQKKVPAPYKKRSAGTILLELHYNKKPVYYVLPPFTKLKTDLSIS